MALITTYATLKSEAANWLNRSDLTDAIATFVQLGEASLKKDMRVRRLENHGSLTVDAATEALPTDFLSLEALYHDGTNHYGPIEIVGAEQLSNFKHDFGDTGIPRVAAIVENTLLFAPEPDTTYTLKLIYWQTVAALSDANTTNWLLTSHPDIYLYATLVESAPYLKDDPRVAVWRSELETRLEQFRTYTWHNQFSGTMRRQHRAIGG